MKKLVVLILIISSLSACVNQYETIDTNKFNQKIEMKTDIQSAKELIEFYYNYPSREGKADISIQTKELGQNKWKAILIHDNLKDDSQKALKIVMKAKMLNGKWIVEEIKKSRKCYKGRGHTSWGKRWCS